MSWKSIFIIVIILAALVLIGAYFLFFRHRKKEILLSLFSIFFTCLILEVVIRIYVPQIMEHDKMFQYDSKLGWKFIPEKKGNIIYQGEAHHYIETNSSGFRDDEHSTDQDDSKKIMVVGDSFVSNISVESEEVFTEVMQAQLENTEVLNFGVNGYGQVQEYLLLQEWQDKINPGLLVFMIYIRNDFKDNMGGHWLYSRPFASWDEENETIQINPTPAPKATDGPSSTPFWRIDNKSHLLVLMKRRIKYLLSDYSNDNQADEKSSIHMPPELYLCHADPSEETKVMFQAMEGLLLRIADYAEESGVPLVYALAPSIVQVEDELWSSVIQDYGSESADYIRSLPNDKLMQFAADNKLPMIDLLPILSSATKKGDTFYNTAEQHWNKAGNQIVADALLDYLRTGGFVGD